MRFIECRATDTSGLETSEQGQKVSHREVPKVAYVCQKKDPCTFALSLRELEISLKELEILFLIR